MKNSGAGFIYSVMAIVLTLAVFAGIGCSSADVSAIQALGHKHKVTMYGCDGKVIGQWETSGKVENETQSNGYYFTDDKTGKLIMVDGTVVIEVE